MPERKPATPVPTLASRAGPSLDDWNLLRSFIAVYETGTLTEAARRLGTTQPSVGRHVRELEGSLGEALFVRLPGRLKPTEQAHALHGVVAAMRASALEAERLFADAREVLVGCVRVAASEVYATHVIATHVGTTELGLFAHEDYLARHGEPDGFDLPAPAFVAGFDREPVPLGPLMKGATPGRPIRFRLRTDAILARYAAVETGLGVGAYLVDVAAERPGLKRVLTERFGQPQEVWLCAHPELRRSASMRFVWSHLEAALRQRLCATGVP